MGTLFIGRRLRGVALIGAVALLVASASPRAASDPALLMEAIRRGDVATVRLLLRDRASLNVNAADADGTTPLHAAVHVDNVAIVTALLRAGANPKAANRYGLQPITLAATNGSAAAIGALLEAGADANTATTAGEPVLMTASRTGNVEAVRVLLRAGAQVNAREPSFGETALMWASAENHAATVQALLDAGAEADARSTVLDAPTLEFPRSGGPNSPFPRGGWTALMFAARDGALDAARVLAGAGATLNLVALPQTDFPLKGADASSADRGVGTTALVFAIINSHYDLAAMLLEQGADPNVADLSGEAALYAAVDMNSLQWVQGRPAPILRDTLDAVDLVTLLLKKGANPNAKLGRTPLKRHHDAGSVLGFNQGATPLMRAARTNDVAVMKALIDGGADPFARLPDQTTVLMLAAGLGYGGLRGEGIRIVVPTPEGAVEAMQLLLGHGLDVDAFNTAGQTALHAAVARGDAVVRFLAERGATLDFKNKAGFTPLDLAMGQGGRGGRPGVPRESTAALLRRLMQERPGRQ